MKVFYQQIHSLGHNWYIHLISLNLVTVHNNACNGNSYTCNNNLAIGRIQDISIFFPYNTSYFKKPRVISGGDCTFLYPYPRSALEGLTFEWHTLFSSVLLWSISEARSTT